MSTQALSPTRKPAPKVRLRWVLAGVAGVALLAAMALSTRVVRIGGEADVQPGVFSPATFGTTQFPKIQSSVESRAVDAPTLAAALGKDQAAAAKQYGVEALGGTEIPVKFTGVVGNGDSGVYEVKAEGVPDTVKITVQTGPAILGTDLRDATGTIKFGQFTNQIEYQNAGSALNKEMKKQVLSKIDASQLSGKTVSVVGVFLLSDPSTWAVTPVKLEVR